MFPTPNEDYNGISIYQTALHLQTQKHEIRVIHPIPLTPCLINSLWNYGKAFHNLPKTFNANGLFVEYLKYPVIPANILKHQSGDILWLTQRKKLLHLTKSFNPDLIWTQPGLCPGITAMRLSHETGIPYIIVVHGMDINIDVEYPNRRKKLLELYKNAAKVIAVGPGMFRGVKEVEPNADCIFIPNGVEACDITPKPPVNRETPLIITTIANLNPDKGIEINIRALRLFLKKHPNTHYNIIGEGKQRQKLQDLAKKLGLENHISFYGSLPHTECMKILDNTHIFSLISRREGFGLVYFEAMIRGIPVVACSGVGISEIIRDGNEGFIIDFGDYEQLADIWIRLTEDTVAYEKMCKKARELVLKEFTWDTIGKRYEDVFLSVTIHSG